MSGHSKWSTIKRQKEVTDKKRGQIFTKLGRAITIAVKESGGVTDPEMNFKLRLAVEKAREANMPKANIDRAIASGAGKGEGAVFEEIMYEGYGPGGAAVMVEVVTDNRNRILSIIKQIFERAGAGMGQPGSVSYLFDQMGWLLVGNRQGVTKEDQVLQIMEIAGVRDVEVTEDRVEVFTEHQLLKSVRKALEDLGEQVRDAEMIMKPKMAKQLSSEEVEKARVFLEKLEDSDEVQRVFTDAILN